MNWAILIARLLPTLILGVEAVSKHLSGGEKKAAVQDTLTGIAEGVAVIVPEHAQPARTAAAVANGTIDGVVQVLTEAGRLNQHKTTTPSAVTSSPATQTAPDVVADVVPEIVVQPITGLHNAVPA